MGYNDNHCIGYSSGTWRSLLLKTLTLHLGLQLYNGWREWDQSAWYLYLHIVSVSSVGLTFESDSTWYCMKTCWLFENCFVQNCTTGLTDLDFPRLSPSHLRLKTPTSHHEQKYQTMKGVKRCSQVPGKSSLILRKYTNILPLLLAYPSPSVTPEPSGIEKLIC